jgi:hypothetical protein
MEIYEQQALARQDFLIHNHHMFRSSYSKRFSNAYFLIGVASIKHSWFTFRHLILPYLLVTAA